MIFLSHTLHNDLNCYNNEKNISIKPYKNNEVEITLRGHCGTHVDFPLHVIEGGKTLKNYNADGFIFKNVSVTPFPEMTDIPKDTDFIILKTGQPRDVLNNIGLDEKTAKYLVENFPNLRAVGIDSVSINAYNNKEEGRKAHKILLGAGILIVEDMYLRALDKPVQKLILAPLQVENADGVPVTVMAKTGYDAIFFDWDGVITDSVNIKTEAYVDMFAGYGKEVQEKVRQHHLQNGGMSRFEKFKLYYKEFLGIDINEAKVQELSKEFSDLVMKKVGQAQFIEGAVETIKIEHKKGTKLFVVTGTPTDEIKEIAKLKGLHDYFTELVGSPVKKDIHTAALLEKYNLKPEKCLFIGDAMADYNAAKATEVNFLEIKIPCCKTEFTGGTIVKSKVEL
jgi:HAD superfamily hydrolase (TIGR01549 family)